MLGVENIPSAATSTDGQATPTLKGYSTTTVWTSSKLENDDFLLTTAVFDEDVLEAVTARTSPAKILFDLKTSELSTIRLDDLEVDDDCASRSSP